MRESIVSFYTTESRARYEGYALVFALVGMYIALSRLVFARSEQETSFGLVFLLAGTVAAAPFVHYFWSRLLARSAESGLRDSRDVEQQDPVLRTLGEIEQAQTPNELKLLTTQLRLELEELRMKPKHNYSDRKYSSK